MDCSEEKKSLPTAAEICISDTCTPVVRPPPAATIGTKPLSDKDNAAGFISNAPEWRAIDLNEVSVPEGTHLYLAAF
jgi:hypothetical protein